jgi:hypothetical protein
MIRSRRVGAAGEKCRTGEFVIELQQKLPDNVRVLCWRAMWPLQTCPGRTTSVRPAPQALRARPACRGNPSR